MMETQPVVTEDGLKVELPPALAKLMVEQRGWSKGRRSRSAGRSAGARVDARAAASDDEPIPMTHIPGVVDGVSMNRVKKMVADREVDVYVEGRTKKIKPSDVRAALATNG